MKPRTRQLLELLERMTPQQQQVVAEIHDFHEAQCATARATFAQPEGTAVGFHKAVDDAVGRTFTEQPGNAKRVACTKGCAHCCHIEVHITEPEARLLIVAAEEAGHEIDREHLRRQRAVDDFRSLYAGARRCVFLKADKTCAVYEHRPNGCRKYFALDTPKHCDTVKHPGARVLFITSIEAEVITSATLGAWPAGRMAQMLLEWLP